MRFLVYSAPIPYMNEILISFGRFSVYTLSVFIVIAFFWGCFVIYKKGLEYHYNTDSLLDFAVLLGVFGFVFARLGFVLMHLDIFVSNWVRIILLTAYPGYDYPGLVAGLVLAVAFLAKRQEIKFYEGLDLVGLGLPAAVAFERIGRVLAGQTTLFLGAPKELLQAFLYLLVFVWLWKAEREYRTFEWYRFRRTQARPGFVFGAFLFLSGIITGISYILPSVNFYYLVLGGASLIAGIALIYSRSGRSLSHDVKLIPLVGRWYTKPK